jgi:hypothetical protein
MTHHLHRKFANLLSYILLYDRASNLRRSFYRDVHYLYIISIQSSLRL